MKEKCSVFERVGYRPRYYIFRPWKWIRLKWRQCKWAYQRAVYGWADSDSWDIDCWFVKVMPSMLRALADDKSGGYPGNDEFPTPESWHDKLYEVAAAIEDYQDEKIDAKNEYAADYFKELGSWQLDGYHGLSDTAKKYYERQKEIEADELVKFRDAMIWISNHFRQLWS